MPKGSEGQTGVAEFQREAWEGSRGQGPCDNRRGRVCSAGSKACRRGLCQWRLGLRTPWMTTPGAEGKRELQQSSTS